MIDGEFDYVIVGAGSAGCVLAARLSENPNVRVALVEAGGADTHPAVQAPMDLFGLFGSELDWAYSTVEQPGLGGRAVPWPRGKALGGSSTINFQMWVPGHREDFAPWVDAAGELWSWESVEPYYRATERWSGAPADGASYGTDGPLWISSPRDPDPVTTRFMEACGELGLKEVVGGLGGGDPTGCALTPLNQLRGARWSSADGYLRPAVDRPNLRVFTDTEVHGILLDQGRATGVELAAGRLTATREVLLAAGVVGSPQLLLRSGIGPGDELRELGIDSEVELPGVGRNLRDHLSVSVTVSATGQFRMVDADTPANRLRYERDRLGPLTSNLAEAVAFLRADGGAGAPDMEIIFTPVGFTAAGTVPGLGLTVIPLQPGSRGRITLASTDPRDAPLIDPAYLSTDSDVTAFVRAIRSAERVFETGALAPMVREPLPPWPGTVGDAALVELIRGQASTMFHPIGTCRLGAAEDDEAVVDERLRVRGVAALRVVDASVIPALPRGHTHAVVAMLAERAAEFIRNDWR